jgi:hypothetical protein
MLTKNNDQLINTLEKLNKSIDFLTTVTALNLGKNTLFNGKETKQEQIEALEIYDLPDKTVALIIGSTPNSVKSLRSEYKKKNTKNKDKTMEEQEAENKIDGQQ